MRLGILTVLILGVGFYGSLQIRTVKAEVELPASDAPVFVELFTSQSCSSCPAADENLKIFLDEPNVVGVACHVTYWDHLRWKDTRSQEFCTKRQREMNAAFDRLNVYTPQLVINGRYQMSGGDDFNLVRNYGRAVRDDIKRVGVNRIGNSLRFDVPDDFLDNEQMRFVVFGYEASPLRQVIGSGENKGEVVTYYNSVKSYDVFNIREISDLSFPVVEGLGYAVIIEGVRTFRVFAVGGFNP